MEPPDGRLVEGKSVVLSATQEGDDSLFIAWKTAGGKVVGTKPRLVVTGAMPDEPYLAEFRKRSDILPPIVRPASTSICVRVGEMFKYVASVDKKSQPVSYTFIGRVPQGVKVDRQNGSLWGKPRSRGSNTVSIVIKGNDVARTVVTNRVTLIVEPPLRRRRR